MDNATQIGTMENMKRKKKILFVTHSLITGGVEKALLNLLKSLQDDTVEVHLLFYRLSGNFKDEFLREMPPQIVIHEIPNSYNFLTNLFCWFHLKLLSLFNGKEIFLATLFKKLYYARTTPLNIPNDIDLAICYHSFFIHLNYTVAEIINAKRKVLWHHVDIAKPLIISSSYLSAYDKIFTVSQAAADIICKKIPQISKKVEVFYNLFDYHKIVALSLDQPIDDRFFGPFKIVTVGRLSAQKGYDLAIKTAYLLKSQGIQFKWFAIGEGEKRKALEHQIKKAKLVHEFILLGNQANPYPYIKNANIYVQPSLYEGYCLTIAEARLIKVPIVARNLACIEEQFKGNGIDALFAEFKPEDFAEKIKYLIKNTSIRKQLVSNLAIPKNYHSELEKLYNLLDE